MISQFLFIGTTELLLIGGMALLLFGGKKLPEMMRGLGQGVREFKKGVNEIKEEVTENKPEDCISDNDSKNGKESLTSGCKETSINDERK